MSLKKKILIGVAFFVLANFGIGYWIFQRIEDVKENNDLSKQIPKEIVMLFDRKSADDYPFQPQKIDWNGKYLLFDEYADLIYNKHRNEVLNTHSYFPNGTINGLVLVRPGSKVVGYYKDDDLETSANQANQRFYTVSYFDLTKKIVLAKDTLWGPMPKNTKRAGENQHGVLPFAGDPDESELIEAIQKRLN